MPFVWRDFCKAGQVFFFFFNFYSESRLNRHTLFERNDFIIFFFFKFISILLSIVTILHLLKNLPKFQQYTWGTPNRRSCQNILSSTFVSKLLVRSPNRKSSRLYFCPHPVLRLVRCQITIRDVKKTFTAHYHSLVTKSTCLRVRT